MAIRQNRLRNKPRKRRFYKRKGFWLGLLLLMLAVAATGLIFVERYTRTYRERAASYDLEQINVLEVPSVILDRNGKEIGRIFVQNRSYRPISEVPERFINALCAGEDSRFFSHNGVDYIGILRAVIYNLEGNSQGASTITQQLARNAYALKQEALRRNESKNDRKLVEIFLALRIERRYTNKRDILEFYLNRIYFGSGYYGIRSASLGYFGKEPKDLSTPECASLVTLIKNPTGRSPLNNPEANLNGRNYVLGRMAEEGMIKLDEASKFMREPLALNPKPLQRGTSHLYERVAEAVSQALGPDGLAQGGFKIHTTILAEAQDAAQQALMASLARAEIRPGYAHPKYADYRKDPDKPAEYLQGAVLMVDHDNGDVLAHVGGRDYAQVPFDFVESGKRPLGTAFFPFLYAAGLSGNETPGTVVEDEAMDNRSVMIGGREGILGEWGMEVDAPVYEGRITARRAFEQSKIAATVRFANMVGLQRIAEVGSAFGLPMHTAELLPRLNVGWEEASMKQAVMGISAFARGGRSGIGKLVYVDRIEDAGGRLRFRREYQLPESRQIIDDATAWQIHSMMAGSCERGSSRGAIDGLIERPFPGAGKGGSTHDFADTWFIGYNKRVTCGVWTGFLQANAGSIYPGAFSRDLALPVWQAAMNAAAPSFGGGRFEVPASVVEAQICTISGQRATQFCQEMVEDETTGKPRSSSTAVTEYFRKGTESMAFCGKHAGTSSDGIPHELAIASLPALNEAPILPKQPVIVGDDPYHAEVPSSTAVSKASGMIRHRTNVLDSLDVGDGDEIIILPRPGRLTIEDD
ncbi:MAG: transglycosylase domain-containing protein [Akkermansiaceae bacterium]|nr:transglycosylase domain-containing protein [Akkermansiaceae bacterium]MCF7730274.1 transglycosylase domain-containing protein [Akkermansiaceae bacterium]